MMSFDLFLELLIFQALYFWHWIRYIGFQYNELYMVWFNS